MRKLSAAAAAAVAGLLLAGCADTPAAEPAVTGKVSGVAAAAAADAATLTPPGVLTAAQLGPGWAPAAAPSVDGMAADPCTMAIPSGSATAAAGLTAPGGAGVTVITVHAAPATVTAWMDVAATVIASCDGGAYRKVQPLPGVDGVTSSAGFRTASDRTWWAVADEQTGYLAVASAATATGNDVDAWTAALAVDGLAAAQNQPVSTLPAPPSGDAVPATGPSATAAAPPSSGVLPVESAAPVAPVAGGGQVVLSDGRTIKVLPAPSSSAAAPGTSPSASPTPLYDQVLPGDADAPLGVPSPGQPVSGGTP